MSLVTHLNSGTQKAGVSTPRKPTAKTFVGGLRNASRRSAAIWSTCLTRLRKLAFKRRSSKPSSIAIAIVHSSKNDDDLPIVR